MKGRRQGDRGFFWLAVTVLALSLTIGAAWYLGGKLRQGAGGRAATHETDPAGGETASGNRRGNIHDRRYEKMAVSLRLYSVYARPLELRDPQAVAPRLAKVLSLEPEELLAALRSERSFVWIGRHIPSVVVEELKEANFRGLYFVEETHRLYPHGRAAAHAVGFFREGKGLGGLEYYYDHLLRGLPPGEPAHETAGGEGAWAGGRSGPVVLTLDLALQKKVEAELAVLVRASAAKAGMAVVMAPGTGEILALANHPTFDPNRFWDFSEEERRNRGISSSIFPGRFGRLFLLAAALELGRKPSLPVADVVAAGPSEPKGEQSATGAEKPKSQASSPLDSILFSDPEGIRYSPYSFLVAKPVLEEKETEVFSARFGFDRKSGIDLHEEEEMESLPFRLDNPRATTRGVRLLRAFASLVNGGRLVTPHLLKAIWDGKSGRLIERPQLPMEEVLKPATVESLQAILSLSGQSDIRLFESYVPLVAIGESGGSGAAASSGDAAVQEGMYQGVLLGYAPANAPGAVLCIAIDGVQVQAVGQSPLRESGGKILKQLLQSLREKEPDPQASLFAVDQGNLFAAWKEMNRDEPQRLSLAASQQPETMPDVRQLSLRKALLALQATGVAINVKGAGKVVRQVPAPGVVLKPDTRVVLELSQDQ